MLGRDAKVGVLQAPQQLQDRAPSRVVVTYAADLLVARSHVGTTGEPPQLEPRKVRLARGGPGALEVEHPREDRLAAAQLEEQVVRIQILVAQRRGHALREQLATYADDLLKQFA